MLEHDEVYELACGMDATWLAQWHFDTEGREGGNGIWAVADTADDLTDAAARIEALENGTLPPGIYTHSETTEEEMRRRWEIWLERVAKKSRKQIAETN